jgi:hypothetical protein
MRKSTIIMLLLTASIWSCQKDEITVVRVPKEAAPSMPPMSGMPGSPPPASMPNLPGPSDEAQNIHWTLPSGWIEQPASQMRVGSFKAKSAGGEEADISVIPLSGEAGGLLSNVNRWRGQISLAPLSEDQVTTNVKTIAPGGRTMKAVDFSNQGREVVAAIYERAAQTWFFKMTGTEKAVGAQKEAFKKFLGSLRFDEAK